MPLAIHVKCLNRQEHLLNPNSKSNRRWMEFSPPTTKTQNPTADGCRVKRRSLMLLRHVAGEFLLRSQSISASHHCTFGILPYIWLCELFPYFYFVFACHCSALDSRPSTVQSHTVDFSANTSCTFRQCIHQAHLFR